MHESVRAVMGWHLSVVATVRSGGMLWTDARELSVVLLIAEIHNDREIQENGGVLASNDMYGASQLCILLMAS